jgi:hypothetical protein
VSTLSRVWVGILAFATVCGPATTQPAAHEPPIGPVQALLNNSDGLRETYICHNGSVSGRVISSQAIKLGGFQCTSHGNYGGFSIGSYRRPVTMYVQLADHADASKMQPLKLVTLHGDFRLVREHHIDYLAVANAKVLYVDPFGR